MKVKEVINFIREQSLSSEESLGFLKELEHMIATISQNVEIADKQDRTMQREYPRGQSPREKTYTKQAARVSLFLKGMRRHERRLKSHFGPFWKVIMSVLEDIHGTLMRKREDMFHRSVDNMSDIIIRVNRMFYSRSLGNRGDDLNPKPNLMKLLKTRGNDRT